MHPGSQLLGLDWRQTRHPHARLRPSPRPPALPHLPLPAGHPLAISTDDPTILNTSVSQELAIAAQAFGLSRRQLRQLALGAADHAFLPDDEKAELRRRMRAKLSLDDSACDEAAAASAAGEGAPAVGCSRPASPVADGSPPAAAAADAPAAAPAVSPAGGDGKGDGKAAGRGRWRFWKSAVRVASS